MIRIIEKISNWLAKHSIGICLCCLVIILLADAFYLVSYLNGLFKTRDYIFSAIYAVLTIGYLIGLPMIIVRTKNFKKAFLAIKQQLDRYYFHGFRLSRYIGTFALWRFQKWLGSGRCYAFSVLAMMSLKDNKTAKLYRGDLYDKNGNFKTRHSWVEFKVPLNGWWVADFSWMLEGFAPKKQFLKAANSSGDRLETKWSCTYDEFWNTPLAKALYEAMKSSETSYIFYMLSAFGSPKDEEYGFTKYCYSEKVVQHAACRYMMPFYDSCDNKPISSRIIRDFVKNPKRQQPKVRSIRLTYAGIKYVDRMKEQQPT